MSVRPIRASRVIRAGREVLGVIRKAIGFLKFEGYAPAGEPKPAIAYGGARIQFFVTPARFIVELVEAPGHEHHFIPDA